MTQQPGSSWGWYTLGYSQFAQQKIGASIKALAKSLELDLSNAEAHKILGRNMMIIGRFDAAQIEFEQGIRYKPDSAELHYNLGKLFSIQDNWEPARKAFEAAHHNRSHVRRSDRCARVWRWKRSATTPAPSPLTRRRSRSTKSDTADSAAPTSI